MILHKSNLRFLPVFFLILGISLIVCPTQAAQKKILTFEDVMKFKEIRSPSISEDGLWITYATEPDRGDGEVLVHGVKNGAKYVVERGSRPQLTKDARWVAMIVKPKAVDMTKAPKDRPKQGLAILETAAGEVEYIDKVLSFVLSEDSRWIAYLHHQEEEKSPENESGHLERKRTNKKTGSLLVLRELGTHVKKDIPHVLAYSFDPTTKYLVFTVSSPDGRENGLYCMDLIQDQPAPHPIIQQENAKFSGLTWTEKGSRLAFLASTDKDADGCFSLWIWDGNTKEKTSAVAAGAVPDSWMIPEKNRISWSKDGKRLFFGLKPIEIHHATQEPDKKEKEDLEESDLFDTQKILENKELDVWHWNDPLIKTNDKIQWPRTRDRTYTAVYHVDSKRFVQLADRDMPEVDLNDNPDFALGQSSIPYRKERSWYGRMEDLYRVSLKDGKRQKIASKLEDRSSLSPGGRYVVYFHWEHWYLFDGQTGQTINLTEDLGVPFYDEDHDYPEMAPSYRTAGWGQNDEFVLIYDKYDIWKFSTATGEAENITGGKGRQTEMTFRVLELEREKSHFENGERLWLSSFHNKKKNHGFYSCRIGKGEVRSLLEENKKFRFQSKAKNADVLMYTRESFEEFPDLWVANLEFSQPKKISLVNPQIDEFAWGKPPELVEWHSIDGVPLQGYLIKPANYEKGKRYPVIVYFYRLESDDLYDFNQMVVNHRPNFPFYTSNGYAFFRPDVKFDIGRPGYSATKCLVPGVQKLIDMGVADPKGIGLHGHSWSGYQAAFVITQTNIFSAAVAGAPVGNMTSAYSGIRWESGIARQMQYEQEQSRIGGSLWEYPERYIENSPVFFADRIQTPLLIQFGDEDGAVPWYQGIELYLAMRRLQKDCVFLQYRGEPHHLKKYPNKLDYSIKMKQYFDHYLKGMPAPEWIKEGVPYLGK